MDLSTIFSDVDNELSYDAYLLDPSVADVQVAGSMVDLYAIPDGNGETEMVVMATSADEENVAENDDGQTINYSMKFDGDDDYVG